MAADLAWAWVCGRPRASGSVLSYEARLDRLRTIRAHARPSCALCGQASARGDDASQVSSRPITSLEAERYGTGACSPAKASREGGDSENALYLRQILVAEIGLLGQRGIAASVPAVGGGTLGHEVAALYARRAGVRGLQDGALPLEELAPTALCAAEEARQVLAGARAATRELLRAAARGRGEVGAGPRDREA